MRSPSSEDEKESSAEIRNPEDYKEIFQPKSAICRLILHLTFFFAFYSVFTLTEECMHYYINI